jgi:hypothetical protein
MPWTPVTQKALIFWHLISITKSIKLEAGLNTENSLKDFFFGPPLTIWYESFGEKMSHEECAEYKDQINQLHEAIYGNSHPENGLIWMAKENRRMINELQEFASAIRKWSIHVFTFLVLAGLSAMGTFLLQLYKFMMTHEA